MKGPGSVGTELESVTGVRQGDPLGHTLFAISLHPLLRKINEKFPLVKIAAISDDLLLACPPSLLQEVLNFVQSEAEPMGLELVR